MLKERSMVHYKTSAAPGQQGNVIVAFHREPHYEHIDQLKVGDTVTVQDRSCTTFTYRITDRWTLAPSKVTQLVSTSGHDLTLITCTPWWRDYDRIVWRATLVGTPGQA
jgi:sortase A